MREWLSGGAPPCQGGGRGFDPRLALLYFKSQMLILKHLGLFVLSPNVKYSQRKRGVKFFCQICCKFEGHLCIMLCLNFQIEKFERRISL